jgi:hypothetical protein
MGRLWAQPLTEMSARNLLWNKEQPVRTADSLTVICTSLIILMRLSGPRSRPTAPQKIW